MRGPGVCIFTETYHPVVGGGETQARLLAEGLVSRGFSVCLLTRRSDAGLKRMERSGKVTVHRLWPTGGGPMKKWGLVLSGLPALLRLRREYDLVFVSGYRIIGIPAVLAGRVLGKPVVLKADSQGEMSGEFFADGLKRLGMTHSGLPFRLFLGLRNRILKRADAFAAITDEAMEELTGAGVRPEVILRVPNGVDTRRFRPAREAEKVSLRRKLGIPESCWVVTYTGRLVSYKGLPMLLRAWQELRRRRDGVKLLLVGTGGLDTHNCEDELRTFVNAEGLEDSVSFTGSVDNVAEYLQASDVFAFPTENDAFPSSLVEAMSCRLPVVTTPVGAIKTIVRDGVNGLMVQPGDLVELLEALDRLLVDKALAGRLGEAGRRTVEERYSAELVTRDLVDLFRKLGLGMGAHS